MHHQSETINEQLAETEAAYLEDGDAGASTEASKEIGSNPMERVRKTNTASRGPGDAPFFEIGP